jgi:putative SOS response-associated peptidase YedK
MPVVIAPADHGAWLAPGPLDGELAGRWNAPWPAERTHVREVGLAVNDPRFDGPECLDPP